MVYFESLSSTSQDLVMLNFEFFGKKLLIGIALIFSVWYLFFYWKQKKDTPYLMAGVGRLLLYITSWICVLSSPMFIFFFYPQIPLDTILQYLILFYTIGYFVAGAIITLNIFYHGANILASFAGIKIDKKSEKVKRHLIGDMIRLMGFRWKN